MAIRYHLDEHVALAIAAGLRQRGMDVTTTADAGLLGAMDEEHLAFSSRDRRVTFTQDDDFLILAASGVGHWGVVYSKQNVRSIGEIIRHLELIYHCMAEDEMRGRIEFF